jgi:response regulator RpfG family c-di-GMP phosphodiesterase
MLGLDNATQTTLWNILETYDGRGLPHRLPGDRVPLSVFIISVAGDLEIFTRVYGIERALALIAKKGGASYPANLVRSVAVQGEQWLRALDRTSADEIEAGLLTAGMRRATSPELIADVIDLKLPWMTGFSRAVAQISKVCCEHAGLERASHDRVYRAGLIHGIGGAAVPNAAYDDPATRSASAWERFRLAPYWTMRAGRQIPALQREAELASFAHERLDGSGYFRGAAGTAIPMEARILGTVVAWVELRSARPWRKALSASEAVAQLMNEAKIGRFDPDIVEYVGSATLADRQRRRRHSNTIRLSSRETEVLHRISLGASNKEVARDLDLSPSTVRTHVESVFRKLECSTRAAATLKASSMGLLP